MSRQLRQPTPGQRLDPPYVTDERSMLDAWLDWHRATLLWKCEGLTSVQLAMQSAEPSTMSLLGLVRHLTDVERSWFRKYMAGEAVEHVYQRPDTEDADFADLGSVTAEEAVRALEAEITRCRATVSGLGLDDLSLRQRRGHSVSLRWIYVHMIEEYARHNGHADLLRERIDGMIGD
jgi:uncharacterized damage-inducible protein DinB